MFIHVNLYCILWCLSNIHEFFEAKYKGLAFKRYFLFFRKILSFMSNIKVNGISSQFHIQQKKFISSKDWAKSNNPEINCVIFMIYFFITFFFSSKISKRIKLFSVSFANVYFLNFILILLWIWIELCFIHKVHFFNNDVFLWLILISLFLFV